MLQNLVAIVKVLELVLNKKMLVSSLSFDKAQDSFIYNLLSFRLLTNTYIIMNSKVFMVLRILLGLFVLIFGANKLYPGGFLPAPEGMSDMAGAYFGALVSAKTIALVGIVEVVAGLALLFNKYGALMSIILMSVSVNAVLFHATLDTGNIAPALVLLILNIAVLYGYKNKYKALFD